jgi:hypothetical protein
MSDYKQKYMLEQYALQKRRFKEKKNFSVTAYSETDGIKKNR